MPTSVETETLAKIRSPETTSVRWRLPVVLLITVIIAYFDRLNISLALPFIAAEHGWTAEQTGKYGGTILSIFFVGYGLANIFFSPIGERVGPRRSLITAVVFFSLFTVAGAATGGILWLFLVTRLLLGLGEGIHFPMNSKLIKNWFPLSERSRANGMWVSGILFATVLAPLILVPIIQWWSWRAMFLLLGIMGMVITIPLLALFCHDTPARHPFISTSEKALIEAGMEAREPEEERFWKQVKPFLRDKTYWLAMLGGIFNNIASFGLLMWFPTYFVEGRGLAFDNLKYALSIPYVISIAGIAFMSWAGDKSQRRAYLAGAGYLLTGVIAFFAVRASSIETTVALFAAALFFQMGFTSQEFAILQRILPRSRVATGTGFYNGVAMLIGGGLGPAIVGGVVALSGNYAAGILAILGAAFLAGFDMLILGRFLKY
ncbi:MAG: MFS transporter [Candidatus Abyssobacteria bacterium SURF_5]|uniref:MFS transporter n=1 Tax=Abyssobacteria bacterium (strain SURF_5) TaxID=2093360 RepID=A0A3A4NBV4_ABYX5|nr:MAG: MFS transporter [Candidatus Abyssubacteria bacterium SURF_5]